MGQKLNKTFIGLPSWGKRRIRQRDVDDEEGEVDPSFIHSSIHSFNREWQMIVLLGNYEINHDRWVYNSVIGQRTSIIPIINIGMDRTTTHVDEQSGYTIPPEQKWKKWRPVVKLIILVVNNLIINLASQLTACGELIINNNNIVIIPVSTRMVRAIIIRRPP